MPFPPAMGAVSIGLSILGILGMAESWYFRGQRDRALVEAAEAKGEAERATEWADACLWERIQWRLYCDNGEARWIQLGEITGFSVTGYRTETTNFNRSLTLWGAETGIEERSRVVFVRFTEDIMETVFILPDREAFVILAGSGQSIAVSSYLEGLTAYAALAGEDVA